MSFSQVIELVVVLSGLLTFGSIIKVQKQHMNYATDTAGPIQARAYNQAGLFLTMIHACMISLPPLVYILLVPLNGLQKPSWIADYNLPGSGASVTLIRLLTCAASVYWIPSLAGDTTKELGTNFSPFGLREKPTVVTSGAYAHVRHPIYQGALLTHIICAIMFWSLIPLFTLTVNFVVFAIKAPLEERQLLEHPDTRRSYEEYQKKVPYLFVPYVY